MGVINVGMEKPHSDALKARLLNLPDQGFDLSAVDRPKHLAVGLHSLCDCVAKIAGQERRGQGEVEVILFKAAFGAHLNDIAEALGRDQSRLSTAAFDQSICCKSGAVDDLGDLSGVDLGLRADAGHALDNGFFWGAIGG